MTARLSYAGKLQSAVQCFADGIPLDFSRSVQSWTTMAESPMTLAKMALGSPAWRPEGVALCPLSQRKIFRWSISLIGMIADGSCVNGFTVVSGLFLVVLCCACSNPGTHTRDIATILDIFISPCFPETPQIHCHELIGASH